MPELLTRTQPAPVIGHDMTARTVTVRLCRWNEPREVSDGGRLYREAYRPGSVELAPDVHVVDHHHGDLIGRADPTSLADDGTGPTVDVILARTAAATDTLALIDAGVIRAVSMELEPISATEAGGVLYRTARVWGIAFAFRPAHDAPILATRDTTDTTTTTTGATAMPDQIPTEPPAGDPPPAPIVHREPAGDLLTREALSGMFDDFRRELVAARPADEPASPLLAHRSLAEFHEAYWHASEADRELLHRALADQITENNPGVTGHPAWISEVQGIVDLGRPVATALGVSPLSGSGMTVDFPYFDGDLTTLVGKQTAEKTAITSARVDIKRGSADIDTYGGASDISYQLIRRSTPAYRELYLRIMYLAYAKVTELACSTAATAAATASTATWTMATGTAADLRAALMLASSEVEDATGMPAQWALVATDVWLAAGGLDGLWPAPYGTQNASGTADARSLRVEVSGLPLVHGRGLADGTMLVGNGAAGEWQEDGPMPVAAEDVERLGQDVGVWGMATYVPLVPAGLRSVATA